MNVEQCGLSAKDIADLIMTAGLVVGGIIFFWLLMKD